jgi:hypothetical protein
VADSDKSGEFRRWLSVMNKTNGYAGIFNYQTATDKTIVELSTVREWCDTIAAEFGAAVGSIKHNPNDPPDCFVTVNGKDQGVELVQLVEAEHKQRAAKGETPYAGQLFEDMQWSKERLVNKVTEIVQSKGEKYERKGVKIDILLIHTDETWLSSSQAREWLSDNEIEPHPSVDSSFLLFSYEPGRSAQHWPGFWIYGNFNQLEDRSGVKSA